MVRRRLQPQPAHGHRQPGLPGLELRHARPQEVGERLQDEVVELLQGLLVADGGGGPQEVHDLGEGEAPAQEAELGVRVLEGVEEGQHLGHLGDLGLQGDLHVAGVAHWRPEEREAQALRPWDALVEGVDLPKLQPAPHGCLGLGACRDGVVGGEDEAPGRPQLVEGVHHARQLLLGAGHGPVVLVPGVQN